MRMNRRSMMKWLVAASASASFGSVLRAADSRISEPKLPPRDFVFIPPDARRHGMIGPNQIAFKLASKDTAGLIASTELVMEAGTLGAPPHLHHGLDEICRVIEGTVHVMVDGNVTAVPAGGWHLRPRGLVHTFWNSGPERARCIEIYVPGGHERYMMDLADLFENGARPQPDALQALAAKHDIEFHFEQLDDVMKRYNVKL
jgi:mannose-6-phosphate isomerase-like protein (cupin superfamily)